MNFGKYDFAVYWGLLVAFFSVLFIPMLFEIGKDMPAYTFTAGTWLIGLGMCILPAWLGYRMGRARNG